MLSFLVIVLGIVALYYWKIYKYLVNLQCIPGPFPLPVIGNALDVITFNKQAILPKFIKFNAKYTRLNKVFVGTKAVLLISEVDTAKFVLSSTDLVKKSSNYAFLRNWLGYGVLTGYGDRWKRKRKIVNKCFHVNQLEHYMNQFNTIADNLVQLLDKEVNQANFDVATYMTVFSLDVIIKVVFGIQLSEDDGRIYLEALHGMSKVVMDRTVKPWQYHDGLYKYATNYLKEKKYLGIINGFAMRAIEERRLLKEQGKINLTKGNLTALDVLLEGRIDGEPLSDEEVKFEINSALYGGHDTTSGALNFTLYCLANHAEVQEKVYEEQVGLFGDDGKQDVTTDHLNRMKYLEAVIKETLRLYPSIPYYGRVVNKDTYFPLLDCTLPKGLEIALCAYNIQRDPKYNKDPDEFIPERYLDESESAAANYLSFSAGPRICIGQKFALCEMKSVLSKIIRCYRLLPASPQRPLVLSADLLLKSASGFHMRVVKR